MREIKFRFFRKNKKEMFYGFPGCRMDYVLGMWEKELRVSKPMQYTGLKDKNGIEVYEGDYARRTYESGTTFVGEIVFEEGTYFLRSDEEYSFLASQYRGEVLEVIGNKYANPELLEAAE